MTEKTGTVKSVETMGMSGIAIVHFLDESFCFIDAGFGARQLYAAIEETGEKEIKYKLDKNNIMQSFDFCEVE